MVMTIALTFVGCDNKVGDIALEKGQTAIHISKDGKVQYGVAESFDKDYYDKKELKSTVENEVDEFNSDSDASGKDALSFKVNGCKERCCDYDYGICINYRLWNIYFKI